MSKLVLLERVVFREPIDCPGRTPDEAKGEPPQYPHRDKILGCYPKPKGLMAKQSYNLWFDPDTDSVVVEHPDSGEQEEIPRAQVAQWRRLKPAAAKVEAAKGKAA